MIVSIMQPAYLPWLGYFDRIAKSDLHIVLDTVQLEHQTKTSFTNRNRILTATGPIWLTVPVRTAGQPDTPIRSIEIATASPWARKHRASLHQAYCRAPYWAEHESFFTHCYEQPFTQLIDVLDLTTTHLLEALRVKTPLVRASTLGVRSTKGDLVVDLCEAVGATRYLSGPFGRNYLDPHRFDRAGIELVYHDYVHPEYSQGRGPFTPYLSAVDLLCWCGPASREIVGESAERSEPEADHPVSYSLG
jgi:hypothetical protein